MKAELKDKEVLAMYDVRGIQNYIFRSNDLQEIIGASKLVENIIVRGLSEVVKENTDWDKEDFLIDWMTDQGTEFFDDKKIQMQVLFIGGGNAYVLFRSGRLCSKVNRKLAMYVLNETYSLNLAVAVVEKTDNYKNDYDAIQKEMRRIKATMPETKPVGIMPFMASDQILGYPLAVYNGRKCKDYGDGTSKYMCTESWLKQSHFPKDEGEEKILYHMVTNKGENSTLAIVHIDGNNMGKRIMSIMDTKEQYVKAIEAMRAISKNIDAGFHAALSKCENHVEEKTKIIKPGSEKKLIRKIICAGDDITFICNASVALSAVEAFITETASHCMYTEPDLSDIENKKKYGLSACAGIAYFNSHFPFCDAYEVAESCCSSAKGRAKSAKCRESGSADGNIGSFVDFQICMNVNAGKLDQYREKQYETDGTGKKIICRPYYVSCDVLDDSGDLNSRNKKFDLSVLRKNIAFFSNTDQFPRSQVKRLRNSFSCGYNEVEKYMEFLKSRQRVFPDTPIESWYDALEIMDYAVTEGGELKCI